MDRKEKRACIAGWCSWNPNTLTLAKVKQKGVTAVDV
jgi:hypothetical protein